MDSRRFIALLVIAAAALAAIVALALAAGGGAADPRETAPQTAPVVTGTVATATPAEMSATPATAPATVMPGSGSQPAAAPAPATDAGVLEAVRALKRFCDLVDDGRRRAASRLLAGPWVWPRRELQVVSRLRFVSARAQANGVTGGVVLLTRVRARLHGPSPLHGGMNTLFFTLGRDGTTGGWLITAVTTSP
jgi:hypothetical protein